MGLPLTIKPLELAVCVQPFSLHGTPSQALQWRGTPLVFKDRHVRLKENR